MYIDLFLSIIKVFLELYLGYLLKQSNIGYTDPINNKDMYIMIANYMPTTNTNFSNLFLFMQGNYSNN